MDYLAHTDWEEVFAGWRAREGNNPAWHQVATEVKGWEDWESWRRFSAEQIGAATRQWDYYSFTDALKEIPAMLVGPFTGWQSRHPKTNLFSFKDLLEIPEQYAYWKNHSKIKSLLADFPRESEFIGLIREDLDKIVCLEGHHRAVAVALAARDNIEMVLAQPRIALSKLSVSEVEIFDEILKRGSAKQAPAQ